MSDTIEPVATLPTKRRKTDLNWELCIICQITKPDTTIHDGSQQGINRYQIGTP